MKETFKVLIADDEYWTRQKICNMIDWEKYNLQLLKPAADGEEVLARMEEVRPDILITDINMPFLNGVELLKIIQEKYGDVITFVISGYDDFEYVKESFLAGSINYLVKPVSRIDLVNALVKALELISERQAREEALVQQRQELLKAASLIEDREFSQLLERKEIPFTPNITMNSNMDFAGSSLMLLKIHNLSALAKRYRYDMNHLSFEMKKKIKEAAGQENIMVFNHVYRSNEFIMVSEADSTELIQIARRLLVDLPGLVSSPLSIVLSEHSYSMDSIHQAYVQTVALLMTRPFVPKDILLWSRKEQEAEEVSSRVSEVRAKELCTLLKSGNKKAVRELIFEKVGMNRCQEQEWGYLEVKQTVKRILNILVEHAAPGLSAPELVNLESMVELADKAVELLDNRYLCEILDDVLECIMAAGQEEPLDSIREVVRQAAGYIDRHYFEPLTLSGLAEQFHVEHSYFSRMFRKETGETLMLYISRCRMDKARQYMKENDRNLTEIAFLVGYDDYTYFNKVFRKMTGISPREYKKRIETDGKHEEE